MRRSRRGSSAVIAAVAALGPAAGLAQPVRPYRPAVDVLDYQFALTLPDTGRAVAGEATVRFARLAPTDTLVLDLVGLAVRDVRVADRQAPFRQDSATVRIALPRAPRSRTRDTLTARVRYAGTPADGLIVSRDSAGRWQAFADNWPDRARHWLPTVDHPSDKATVSWTVDAPRARTVVANGALLGVQDVPAAPGGTARRVTRWRESRPISPHLMVIAAAPMVRVDLGATACGFAALGRCVPQSVYLAPELLGFAPGAFRAAEDIVRGFAALVAPFPYEALAHLQSSTRFGGMENAGAIFYADALFRRGTLRRDLVAHETAHQWFGDAVTQREWSHLWLSEGFATYWAALDLRRSAGDSAFLVEMRRTRDVIAAAPEVAARPVIDTAQTRLVDLLNRNSYEKGGWTLHMLRGLVGDSAFFRGVRAYYVAHRDGTALTGDLRAAIEASAGRPLGWFFDQWLRRPGFPELAVRWRYDAAAQRVRLTVTQGPRFAPYRFPLAVDVVDDEGRPRRVTVEVPAEHESTRVLELPLAAPPRAVRPDPDTQLLATFVTTGG
jgi:aminopeptidase N